MKIVCLLFTLLFATAGAATHSASIPAEGRDPAAVFLPDDYSPGKQYPLIILLHGYANTGDGIDKYFRFSEKVTDRQFILVVPNGKKDSGGYQFWNATDGCCDFDRTNSDDVGYIETLISQVESQYSVDTGRVFAAGHSNGGFMSYRLACEPNSPISRIVSLAGETFLDPTKCRATHPMRVLQIHALDDDTIKYDGDINGYQGLNGYPSTEATIGQWLKINFCADPPQSLGTAQITVNNTTDMQQWCDTVQLWAIRAGGACGTSPHMPQLTDDFTEQTLDFLLR